MSIANDLTRINFSNLRRMFETFCDRVFEYQKEVLSQTSQGIEIKEEVNADESSAIEETISELEHPTDPKSIHHFISMIIKSALDSEKIPSFRKSAKEVVYAMTAIADEIFLNMNWEGKQFWEMNMLESRFFGTQIAGEEIFERINLLLAEKDALETERAEIYLDMLSFGFKGKFRDLENENIEINLYKRRLFDFITQKDIEAFNIAEYRIFQKEYSFTMPTIRRKLLPDGSIINYLSAFFIFMFISVSTMAWLFETRDLHRLLHEISEIALKEH